MATFLNFIVLFVVAFSTMPISDAQFDSDESSTPCGGANKSWLVSILAGESEFSGTLIHPRAVLTAAHLLNSTHNVRNTYVRINGRRRDISKFHVHPRFNSRLINFDLVILELLDSVDDAAIVCLPDVNKYYSVGSMKYFTSIVTNTGEEHHVELLKSGKCELLLRRSLGRGFKLKLGSRCSQGTCQAKAGHPLMFAEGGNKWIQIGISSWGLNDCGDKPEVYSDIIFCNYWISEILSYVINV